MSFFLPLAILSLFAVAAPVPDWARTNSFTDIDLGIPDLGLGTHTGALIPRAPTLIPKSSLVSSTSATDSLSLTGTDLDLDTGLSSTLQGLGSVNSVLNSCVCTWVPFGNLVDYVGAETLNLAIPATGLVVQAGEDPETWVSIPEGKTSSQAATDLESLSWVLLDDLACSLTEDAFVPVQSILVYQPDESSNAAVYVSLTDPDSTLGVLSLDHTVASLSYDDIVGVSSELGLGSDLVAAPPPSDDLPSDPSSEVPPYVVSETDLSAAYDGLGLDTNIVTDVTSDLLTSTSSSSHLDTDLVDNLSDSSVAVDVTSDPDFSSPTNLGVTPCS